MNHSWPGVAGTAWDPLFLSPDEILEIHEQQIESHGGSSGIRDAGGLESAIATPQATFEGELVDLVLAVVSETVRKSDLIQAFETRCRSVSSA
jgi:hypothetical protein